MIKMRVDAIPLVARILDFYQIEESLSIEREKTKVKEALSSQVSFTYKI